MTYAPNSHCGDYTTAEASTRSTTTAFVNNLDCNFDCNCTCRWVDDPTSEFKWTVWKGPTPTQLTGPSADQTTDSLSGYYIYIETSSPRKENDAARITSNFIDVTFSNGGCFKFFYHMFGADIGRLNIYSQFNNNSVFGSYGKPIWQKQGNQGDKWYYGQVYVNGTSLYRTRFIIEGIVIIFLFYKL